MHGEECTSENSNSKWRNRDGNSVLCSHYQAPDLKTLVNNHVNVFHAN